jgi:hypothetical protein
MYLYSFTSLRQNFSLIPTRIPSPLCGNLIALTGRTLEIKLTGNDTKPIIGLADHPVRVAALASKEE